MSGSSKSSNLAIYAGIAALATLAIVVAVVMSLEHTYDEDLWDIIKDAHDFSKPLTEAEIDELWKVADADGSGTISESELRSMMIKLWEIQVEKVRKIALESAEDCRKAMVKANTPKLGQKDHKKPYTQEKIDELIHRLKHPAALDDAEAHLKEAMHTGTVAKKLFQELDVDGNGSISKGEWTTAINKMLHKIFANDKILTKNAFRLEKTGKSGRWN